MNNINYQESLSNSDVNDFQIDQKQIIDNDFTYAPIEFNISFLALPKKKLFEIEIKNKNNYKKNISPKFQLGTKEKRTKNKIIKLSVKSMQENLKTEKKNYEITSNLGDTKSENKKGCMITILIAITTTLSVLFIM